MKIAMSAAASGLLRALLARAAIPRDRILLTDLRSTDWQSLTFIGERHEIELRIPGPDAPEIGSRIASGLDHAEFKIPGQIVADVALIEEPLAQDDGSLMLKIEALTIVQ
jgi:hypothetical protein